MAETGRVPPHLVAGGGIAFVLSLFVFYWLAFIGIIIGAYILYKYPKKWIHGAIPVALNAFSVTAYLVLSGWAYSLI